jgi:hypothetical protein
MAATASTAAVAAATVVATGKRQNLSFQGRSARETGGTPSEPGLQARLAGSLAPGPPPNNAEINAEIERGFKTRGFRVG